MALLSLASARISAAAVALVGSILCPGAYAQGQTTRQILRADAAQANLLKDDAWQPYQKAFPFRREGAVFTCDDAADAKALCGISQTVVLNQASPQPIIASAWSKAEGVGGQQDSDYSLYLIWSIRMASPCGAR